MVAFFLDADEQTEHDRYVPVQRCKFLLIIRTFNNPHINNPHLCDRCTIQTRQLCSDTCIDNGYVHGRSSYDREIRPVRAVLTIYKNAAIEVEK